MGSGNVECTIDSGNYDLRVHPIVFPEDIDAVIRDEERKNTQSGFPQNVSLSLNVSSRTQIESFAWKECKCSIAVT